MNCNEINSINGGGDIAYYPFINTENKYIGISQDILRHLRYNVIEFNNRKPFSRDFNADVIILNWYESLYIESIAEMLKGILVRTIGLQLSKCRGAKIVTTFHNRKPHESGNVFVR
ncbi:hypothetical protein EXW11_05890 [Enterococcus faecium]|nr:hypothetical protein [Enterococcus faecium]